MQIYGVMMRLIVVFNILLQINGEYLHSLPSGIKPYSEQEQQPEHNVYRTKLSKLRLILFGDIFNEIPAQQQLNIITCITNSSSLNVTTKNCPCETYSCKDLSPSTSTFNLINQRKIHASCRDYCCRKKKANRSISRNQIPPNQNQVPSPRTWCNKQEKQIVNSNGIVSWLYRINLIEKGTTICVGALIYPDVILTTAVCVINKKPSEIFVENQSVENGINGRLIVGKIILHENVSNSFERLEHNVALLILEDKYKQKDAEISNELGSYICLPSILNFAIASSNVCRIYSWKENSSDTLNQVSNYSIANISIYLQDECEKVHEEYANPGNICAGLPENADAEVDLSGSPLVCISEKDGKQYVLGLLTWSTSINKSPHLFTNMDNYQEWVYNEIEKLDI